MASGLGLGGERQRVTGPSVWRAVDLVDPAIGTVELSEAQRAELVAEATAAADNGRTVTTLTVDDMPLTSLRPVVDTTVRELSAGRGFVLLRGFPLEDLSDAATELGYVGLGLHLGTPVGQDAKASLSSDCSASIARSRAARAGWQARTPSTTTSSRRGRTCSRFCTSRSHGTATTSNRPATRRTFFSRPSMTWTAYRGSSTSAGTSATRNVTRTPLG